ncbi:MAG: hypothetical protein ACO37F_13825 [Pirellulales bacterium]
MNIEDQNVAPFEAYLLIEMGDESKAFELLPDDELDIPDLLSLYWGPDYTVNVGDDFEFNNRATIMTDWREPASPICWESGTFEVEMN